MMMSRKHNISSFNLVCRGNELPLFIGRGHGIGILNLQLTW